MLRFPVGVLLLAAMVLTMTAWLRSAEYDEQYTLFLTAGHFNPGTPRPAWPGTVFPAADVRMAQSTVQSTSQGGLREMRESMPGRAARIARDLRATDVHPPLYFWLAAEWRRLAGDGLFTVRLLSVGFALAALALVGRIAHESGMPPALPMLLTLGCYGFAYTGTIARGFALAQCLLLAGIALAGIGVTRRPPRSGTREQSGSIADPCPVPSWRSLVLPAMLRPLLADGRIARLAAGALLGGACLANYLAVFICAPVVVLAVRRARHGLWLAAGFAAVLPASGWFFLAQRGSRSDQFPPFEWLPSLARLAEYQAANILGGLPLYVGATARPAVTAILGLGLFLLVVLVIARWRHVAPSPARDLFALAAVAPSLGLLALGIMFNNTPIELRYLSFSAPFVALLLAGAMARGQRAPHADAVMHAGQRFAGFCGTAGQFGARARRFRRLFRSGLPGAICAAVVTLQAASLAGLMLRAETMQPARATAQAAARLASTGADVVLLPRGNDGVGIVGAFAIEAPPALPLLLIRPDDLPQTIRTRVAGFNRVVLALLAQDEASRRTLPTMQAAFDHPCWRKSAEGFNVEAHDRICETE